MNNARKARNIREFAPEKFDVIDKSARLKTTIIVYFRAESVKPDPTSTSAAYTLPLSFRLAKNHAICFCNNAHRSQNSQRLNLD